MEHWKRKQMRLNYRWDLTGFEEEEVSGLGACAPAPPPACPPRPPPCCFWEAHAEALVLKPRRGCSLPASQFPSLLFESPAVAGATV